MDSSKTLSDSGLPLRQIIADLRKKLAPKYGEGEAKAMIRIIFENLKGWTPVDLALRGDEEISGFIQGKIDGITTRLLNDEPIQHIFGKADFYGMTFKVTSDTLIPRPETAELVDLIVKENQTKDLRVLDAGTGSGCIAIALQRNLPFPEVTGIDISEAAIKVAKTNSLNLHAPIDFIIADMLRLPASLPGKQFDIVVSNPPYIAEKEKSAMEHNVKEFEPASALFVPDDDPLLFYRAILKACSEGDFLAPGGRIYFEINPIYADDIASMSGNFGMTDIDILLDSYGKRRFLTCVKPTEI